MEEDLPSQWSPKTGKDSNAYLGQSRRQTYIDQRRTYRDKEGHMEIKKDTPY
jgi:hypothetical protein